MRRYSLGTIAFLIALISYGCANPAANKPKASVGNAAPESNTAKPAGGEKLTINPENSKVEFVAAKVTRSHNGSFKQFGGTIFFGCLSTILVVVRLPDCWLPIPRKLTSQRSG